MLAIPRLSPARELALLQALIKPQTGRHLRHHLEAGDTGEQPWPDDAVDRVARVADAARRELALPIDFHLPAAGEYLTLARVAPQDLPAGLAVAVLLSKVFPDAWVVIGRLFVLGGRFYRRERGVKLNLRPADNVHLSREHRQAVTRAASDIALPHD